MKKILFLLACGVLWGCQQTSVLETEYLELKYPSQWTINTENAIAKEEGFEHVLATYMFDMGEELKSQIIINIEQKNSNLSLEEYRSVAKEYLGSNIQNIEFIKEETVTVNGAPSLVLSHKHSGRNWIQVWTEHDDKIYTTTLATSAPVLDTCRQNLQALLGSIKLKP